MQKRIDQNKNIKAKTPEHVHRKPTKKERDDHFAALIPGVLNYHALMLADGLRNQLLYKAIKQNVNAETNFLDVGAGAGVWAILAAKLGAKRGRDTSGRLAIHWPARFHVYLPACADGGSGRGAQRRGGLEGPLPLLRRPELR